MVLFEFSVEPLDCFKKLALVSAIERFIKKEVVLLVRRCLLFLSRLLLHSRLLVPSKGGTDNQTQDEAEFDYAATHSHQLQLSKRDWGTAGVRSSHCQLHQLWLNFLMEREVLCAVEVRAALKLAVNKHVELVFSRGHIADVDPLHATLAQCLKLLGAIDVVRNQLTVDLEPHGIEAQFVAFGQCHEDCDLCP